MRNLAIAFVAGALVAFPATAEETVLLWGDTHLHTYLSPDAYLLENRRVTPDDAFRFARGEPVIAAYTNAKVQLDTPLDFLVVTDHSEYVGVMPLIQTGDPRIMSSERGRADNAAFQEDPLAVFATLIEGVNTNQPEPAYIQDDLLGSVWQDIAAAADRQNRPGEFSAFIGWEWSSTPNGNNLHRVVFTYSDAEAAGQILPYSSFNSQDPEDLWDWIQATSEETGMDFMVIPHNSNISGGLFFDDETYTGGPITAAYGRQRMAMEPVVEVTQIKGDSETHPDLSPEDPFADYETYEHRIDVVSDADAEHSADPGDYARSGLLRGLEFAESTGVNPYQFGMIGSTDAHTGLSSTEEDNFWGKMSLDSTPDNGNAEILPGVLGWDMSAAGLAAVWATENTREAIFDAFRRKEVYATTGPRIQLRFFGGWGFQDYHANLRDVATVGYDMGVPMGGELTDADDRAPSFLIHAVKDPVGANLDRVQVVKGWIDDDGMTHEQVYDVALSDGRRDGAQMVGSTVDAASASYTNDIGDPQLSVVWTDPDFDEDQRAFYYVRVLQIPTPRNSTYDAVALGIDPAETGHAIEIQERAYSSPIWYTP